VRVTDANGVFDDQALSITISNTLVITTTTLPGATMGTAYSQTLASTGGTTPLSWSITVGSLPAGLTLTASTGVIAGTPTTAGTSNFTVRVTDANSFFDDQALAIVVSAAPIVTTATLPGATVGAAYSQTLAATGASYVKPFANVATVPPGLITWTVTRPALPGGVVPVSCVADWTSTFVAALSPNLTVVMPTTKLVPRIVTVVPPEIEPEPGVIV
jgi:hypothetical protein